MADKIDGEYLEKTYWYGPFDNHIRFDEEPHLYFIDGKQVDQSVTTFVHHFFPEFNADKVIEKMMKGRKWKESKYYGMTPEQIKQQWEDNRVMAAELGTEMHFRIETFYNHPTLWRDGGDFEKYFDKKVLDNKEFQQFLNFHCTGPRNWGWAPFRTELRVFDRDYDLAGSVDMLYKSPNYSEDNPLLIMLDWKRSKEIRKSNKWESAFPPIEDLPHCNFYQYSLQLNVYKAIIEKNTHFRVEFMALGVFHPSQNSYQFLPVQVMPRHVDAILKAREEELKKKVPTLENFVSSN